MALVLARGDSLVATRSGSWRLVGGSRGDSWGFSRACASAVPYWVSPPWPCLGFGPRPGIRGVSCRCLASCLFLVVLLGVVSRLDYGVPAASGLGRGLLLLSWVWVCPVQVASWSCSCPGLSLDFVRSWVVLGRVTSCLLHRLRLRGRSLHCSLWLSRLVLPCWPAAGTLLARYWLACGAVRRCTEQPCRTVLGRRELRAFYEVTPPWVCLDRPRVLPAVSGSHSLLG